MGGGGVGEVGSGGGGERGRRRAGAAAGDGRLYMRTVGNDEFNRRF